MPFKFLPLKELETNIENLFAKEYEKHSWIKPSAKREDMIKLVREIIIRLNKMPSIDVDPSGVTSWYQQRLTSLKNKIRTASNEYQALEEKAEQMSDEMAINKAQTMLEEQSTEILSLKESYESLLRLSLLPKQTGILSDLDKSMILSGAMLHIKKAIASEYTGTVNEILRLIINNNPENSIIYNGVNSAIGSHAENVIESGEEKAAITAFNVFYQRIEAIKRLDIPKLKETKLNKIEFAPFDKNFEQSYQQVVRLLSDIEHFNRDEDFKRHIRRDSITNCYLSDKLAKEEKWYQNSQPINDAAVKTKFRTNVMPQLMLFNAKTLKPIPQETTSTLPVKFRAE